MAWKVGNPGCACCDDDTPPDPPCDTVITVDVYGCPGRYNSASPSTANPADGATVEVVRASDDVVLASGTTNASGRVVITTPTATRPLAAYVRVPAWCNYAEYVSNEITLNCLPLSVGLNLLAAEGYVCCSCPHPLPEEGTFTCSQGAFTLSNVEFGVNTCTYRGVVTFTGPVIAASDDTYTCVCNEGLPNEQTIEECKFKVVSGTVSVPVAVTVSWTPNPATLLPMDPPLVTVAIDWEARVGQTGCSTCDWGYAATLAPGSNPCAYFVDPPTAHKASASDTMTCTGCGELAADGVFPDSFDYTLYLWNCDALTAPVSPDCTVTIDNPLAGAWSFDLP